MSSSVGVTSDGLSLAAGACLTGDARRMVVLLHGIPSVNPPDPDDAGYPGLARRFADQGWNALWVSLRGMKGSEGFFSIEGWVRDAMAAVETARALVPGVGFLALLGSSAGGAVAAEAARRQAAVDAIALLGAPAAWSFFAADPAAGTTRITTEAGMPLAEDVLRDPTAWGAEFDAVSTELSVAEVGVPTLIVHGSEDDVVPLEHAYRIAARAPRGELEIIEGAGHVLRRDERAVNIVLRWLERITT